MGTQQLLMIVICVIVVAAAIGVGIAMFNQRDFSFKLPSHNGRNASFYCQGS